MMKQLLWSSFVSVLLAFSAGLSHAQLILVVNTADETVTIMGTDSGMDTSFFQARWQIGNDDKANAIDIEDLLTPASDVVSGSLLVNDAGKVEVALAFEAPGGQSRTVTGSGAPASYAGFSAGEKAVLEGAIGSNLILDTGSGFGPIAVQAGPVPVEVLTWGLAKGKFR